ncbi:MAG: hypothetical protein WBX01_17270 [Nitrososphaeraceae archaeon]
MDPVLFGIVIALASVLAVSTISLQNVTASSCSSLLSGDADVDVAEAEEAGNTTMMTNRTTNGNGVEFLSIQSAQSGSITQINETAYTLELNNVANKTILFSDRPERIVETISTTDFVGNWSTGQNSFSSDEPNDALIVEDTQTGNLDTFVIESFNPVYDIATNSLTYTITAENATINLLGEFGQSVLVIDGHKVGDYPFHFPQQHIA